MFEKNVGNTDRVIRLVLGIILLALGIFFVTTGTTTLGYILAGVSLIPLVTALFSTCPIYSAIGVSTKA